MNLPKNRNILFIRSGPALALLHKKSSDFYSSFPLNRMADWQIILWRILWNSNHWILFIADRKITKSFLINTTRQTLSQQMELFQKNLTDIIEDLTNPEKTINLKVSTIDKPIPKENNEDDCGVFICCHAIDYCKGSEIFHSLCNPKMREHK